MVSNRTDRVFCLMLAFGLLLTSALADVYRAHLVLVASTQKHRDTQADDPDDSPAETISFSELAWDRPTDGSIRIDVPNALSPRKVQHKFKRGRTSVASVSGWLDAGQSWLTAGSSLLMLPIPPPALLS